MPNNPSQIIAAGAIAGGAFAYYHFRKQGHSVDRRIDFFLKLHVAAIMRATPSAPAAMKAVIAVRKANKLTVLSNAKFHESNKYCTRSDEDQRNELRKGFVIRQEQEVQTSSD